MTSQVNFQATGFVILFAATGKGAGKELLFSEVGSVVGKQSTHRDEGLLTAWTKKTQTCSLVWQKPEDSYTSHHPGHCWHWSRRGKKWFRSTSGKLLPLTPGFVVAKLGLAKHTKDTCLKWLRDEGSDQGKVLQSQPSICSTLWHRSCIHFVNSKVSAVEVKSKKIQLDTKEQDSVY